MKRFSQWSINLQLLLSLGSGVAIIFAVSLYLNFQATEARIKTEGKLHAKEAVVKMINSLVTELDRIELSTSMLAVIVEHSHYSEDELTDVLKNIVLSNPNIYGASIAIEPKYAKNKQGFAPYFYRPQVAKLEGSISATLDVKPLKNKTSLLYSDLARNNYNYTQKVWYANAKVQGKPSWSSPYFDDGGGDMYMTTFTVPIITENGFYGVVTGDLSLQSMNDIVQSIGISKDAYALLLDHSLNIMSGPKAEFFMKPIQSMLGDTSKQLGWKKALELMSNGGDSVDNLPCPDQKGNCIVAYLSLSSNSNWPLLVIYPEDKMYAEIISFTTKYAAFALFFMALLATYVTWLVQRLTKPLTMLSGAAEKFGKGNIYTSLPDISSSAETKSLVQAFKKMQTTLIEYIDRLQSETAHSNRLEGELSAATQIQMEMLPGNGLAKLNFSNLSLWAHVKPAKSVGGDLYHYRIVKNKLTFIVGDVSDKGVPAALFMATTVSLFKQYSQQNLLPANILLNLNRALEEHNDACMFVTAFVGELNLGTGELHYSSAGHTPPLLNIDASLCELEQNTGSALGLVEGADYPSASIMLTPRSQLIIYTDGVDEAFNTDKTMYGLKRLLTTVRSLGVSSTQAVGESIFSSVADFSVGQNQSDDITVMVLEYKPAFKFLINDVHFSCDSEHISVPASNHSMSQIIQAIDNHLLASSLEHYNLGDIRIVVEELFVNAITHGQLALDNIEFHFSQCNGHLMIEMIDSGIAFNPFEESPEPELGLNSDEVAIGGLGVHLIKSMSIQKKYRRLRDKNHICLLIHCESNQ